MSGKNAAAIRTSTGRSAIARATDASFEGTYDYRPDACLKLREMNNDDSWVPLQIAIS
jgi:hypothetical protein